MQTWGTRRLSHLFNSCSLPLLPTFLSQRPPPSTSPGLYFCRRAWNSSHPKVKSRAFRKPRLFSESIVKPKVSDYSAGIPMATSVEIASAPTVDTPGTCLFVHSERRAYLFGRPEEGTQRAFQSRRLGMGATEQVFLSGSVSWELVGGLFGYVLTVGGALEASREQTAVMNEERKSKGQKLTKQAA